MCGGGGMWVRCDVTSGSNRGWEWRPDAGDAEDGKTTSDATGRGARASDAGLIFADKHRLSCGCPTDQKLFEGYIRGVRVTTSWGATCITPGNHPRAYFDLRLLV